MKVKYSTFTYSAVANLPFFSRGNGVLSFVHVIVKHSREEFLLWKTGSQNSLNSYLLIKSLLCEAVLEPGDKMMKRDNPQTSQQR